MNKIKLISIVALAGTLTLAGCGEKHQHTWDNKWSTNENQHWVIATCHPEICDLLGDHVDENNDGQCDTCGYQMGSIPTPVDPTAPTVASVTVTGNKTSVPAGQTVSLQASVRVLNGASNGVTWSVNNPSLATLSSTSGSSVTLTGEAAGTVVVTATSTFDSTKKGSLTITITQPEWSASVKAMMQEYLGIVVPYFEGNFTWTDEYFEEYECLTAESSNSSDLAKAIAGFTAAGWEVYDYGEEGAEAIYEVGDKQYYADIYEYDGLVSVDVYAFEIVREWPSEDLAEALEALDIDFTLPVFTTTESVRYSLDVELDEESGEGYIDLNVYPESETSTISHLDYVALFDDSFTKTQDEYGDYEIVPEDKSCTIYVMSVLNDDYEEIPGFEVIVVPYIADYTIKASVESEFIKTGETATVTVEKIGEDLPDGAVISFASDNETVATVSAAGVITAVAEGKAVITASYEGFTSSVTIFVKDELATEFTVDQLAMFKNIHDVDGLAIPFNAHFNDVAFNLEDKVVEVRGDVVGVESALNYRETLLAAGWVDLLEEQGVYEEYYELYAAIAAMFGAEITMDDVMAMMAFEGISFEKEVKIDDSTSYWINADLYLDAEDEEAEEGILCVDVYDPYMYLYGDAKEAAEGILEELELVSEAKLPENIPGSHFYAGEDEGEVLLLAYDSTASLEDLKTSFGATGFTLESVTEEGVTYLKGMSTDEVLDIEIYNFEGLIQVVIGAHSVITGVTFDFLEITDPESYEIDGFKYVTAVGTNSSKQLPQYNSDKSELRLYIGNTITISSEEPMTSIFFDANTCGETKADGTLSVNVGSVDEVDGGFYWEGEATSVTFTVVSGKQFHINAIDINGGSEGGGVTPTPPAGDVLADVKEIAAGIAANLFDCEVGEVTFGDFTDYYATEDVLIYEDEDLTFADVYDEYDVDERTFASYENYLKSFIPAGAVYDVTSEGYNEEYGYIDLWYTLGDYTIAAYAQLDSYLDDQEEEVDYVWISFDIFPTSQTDAYIDLMYPSEE